MLAIKTLVINVTVLSPKNKMKKILYNCFAIFMTLIVASCKKDNTTPPGVATFLVVNMINNGGPVKADFTGKENVFATTAFETEYPRSNRFVVTASQTVPVKIVSSLNTDEVLFNRSFMFQPGDIYALFLTGTPDNVDTLLLKQDIASVADSSMAVQFVNCSPTGLVKIVPVFNDYNGTSTPQSPILLNYKEHSEFMSFSVPYSLVSYTFEYRDPVTDELWGSNTIEWNTFHTTFVIRGYGGGDPAMRATRVNYEVF